uniref:FRIGIDA-like protein n=1 Tax=Noccaea caerulescens TaxID=107243 RepID=A0A1J3KAL1_NOCCA
MEKTSVEDELTLTVNTDCKRQKLSTPLLEDFKADSSQKLKALHDHLDIVVEERSREVKLKENQLKILSLNLAEVQKQTEAARIEALNKEKELDLLRNEIKSEETTLKNTQDELESKKKDFGEVQKQIKAAETEACHKLKELDLLRNQIKSEELKKKELRLRSTVLVKHEEQPIQAETELWIREFSSDSLDRDEVSSYLRALSNPAKFVLDLVEGQIRAAQRRQRSGLQDPVVENLVMFFEELAKTGGWDKDQMRFKAMQVGTQWKKMIVIESPSSSLEALAFLLFIVGYEVTRLIDKEETVLLATSVLHYEQGPELFHLLGLNRNIPEFIRELIEDHQYIPAARIICLFKRKDFSATTLLMKEITDLRRRSSVEKAEKRDIGKFKAIVELAAGYDLDIDIPAGLTAKLMLQSKNSTPPVEETCGSGPSSVSKATSSQVAATHSSAGLLVPKHETKPFVNASVISQG